MNSLIFSEIQNNFKMIHDTANNNDGANQRLCFGMSKLFFFNT